MKEHISEGLCRTSRAPYGGFEVLPKERGGKLGKQALVLGREEREAREGEIPHGQARRLVKLPHEPEGGEGAKVTGKSGEQQVCAVPAFFDA